MAPYGVAASNQTGDRQLVDLVPPFEQSDYVLITQFENLTNEPLFDDGTLKYALELREASRSPLASS